VAVIGSGSFACAMLHIVAANVLVRDEFHPQIKCWVHDAKAEYEASSSARTFLDQVLGA